MKKFFLLLFSLIFTVSISFSQQIIKGNVSDSKNGEPIPGTSIVQKGTTNGTLTDLNGNYELNVSQANATLVFSFIGYEPIEIALNGQSVVDIALEVATTTLEDIVVIGYGVQRKSDLTGSVSTVKSEDLIRIPNSSPMQALQGKVAGLQIVTNSGAPGSGVIVRIRGVGTFNNSSPIYIVDGVILDNIDFLNSADIESIEVLKDASATTIYGARGANGVIIVSTKRAKAGVKNVLINFSAESSIQKLQKPIELLSGKEFATIVNEINPGTYNNIDAVPEFDWQDQIFSDGLAAPIFNAQFSASASSEKGQYYFGLGYFSKEGIIEKSNFERITIKLNNTYHLSKRMRVGNNITITPNKQQNTNGNAVFVAYRAWPVLEPYNADGTYTPLPGTGNPIADIEYTNSFSKSLRGSGNFYTELDLAKGLMFKSSFGIDMALYKNTSFTPEFFVSPQQQNTMSRLYKGESTNSSWVWENTLNYSREIEKHRFDILGGYTMQSVNSESFGMTGENLTRENEDFWYINSNNINPNSVYHGVDANLNYSMISYLGRVNYSFDSRYLFTATYRIDGSSKFTEANRFAGFPAVAVGWNLHNESFLEANKAISNLKLKASWGGVGNEKIAYDNQYSLVGNGINAVFGIGDVIVPGQTYSTTGNPDLRWETTYQTNIGLELGLWESKFTAEIDYFNKKTKDILIALQLPGFVGNGSGSTITKNAAEILNSGVEFNFRWNDNFGKLNYSVGLLGSSLHNEALVVRGTSASDDFLIGGGGLTRSVVGEAVGSFFGYKVDGIFQNQTEINAYPHRADAKPGDLRYVDFNNDGNITDDDRTFIGSPIPDLLYGINISLSYRNLSLNLDFQGQYGNEIYNVKETIRPDLYNFEKHVYQRWTGEGTSNTEPRATAGGYNYLPSEHYVQDGSFFSLRNMMLGYELPENLVKRLKAQSINVYVSGTNIFILKKYTGYSPEILGGPIDSGLDYGTYPTSSIYSLGFRLSF